MSTTSPVVLLVTQVREAGALAAACAMAKLEVDCFDSEAGAVAILTPGETWRADAKAISHLLRSVPVLALESDGTQINCVRFTNGEEGETLPPGLVLSGLPAVLSDVLTGAAGLDDLDTTSSQMSRWRAMRILASKRMRR